MQSVAINSWGRLRDLILSPWTYRLVRWSLGAVFVVAGSIKLADIAGFAEIIARYHLAPAALVPWTAVGLPVLEVLAGLGLMVDVRFTLEAVTGMLGVFAWVLYYGALKGLTVDCGCFSSGELAEHASLWEAFYRDLGLLAAAAFIYFWRRAGRPLLTRTSWRYHLKSIEEGS